MPFDPIKLAKNYEKIVTKDSKRKYYRFRADRWYGGIATADAVSCCLRCAFCWVKYPLEHPEKVGSFYSPQQVFERLDKIAKKNNFHRLRVSGAEPTIGRQHLLELLEIVSDSPYTFILETNGILLGVDERYVEELSKFPKLHVRISLKAGTPERFELITGADKKAFWHPLKAIEYLIDHKVRFHPSIVITLLTNEEKENVVKLLYGINSNLLNSLEEEELIFYPHVKERLAKKGINVT